MKRNILLAVVLLTFFALVIACQPAAAPKPTPTPVPTTIVVFEPVSSFAAGAFPPEMPDIEQHHNAWLITDCLGCHSNDAGEAPTVEHKDLPEIYLTVNCRTCHVPKPSGE